MKQIKRRFLTPNSAILFCIGVAHWNNVHFHRHFSSLFVDAFPPITPRSRYYRLPISTLGLAATPSQSQSQSADANADATAPNGFWEQPSSIIKSRLSSPPPDHVLALIKSQPYRGGFEPAQDFKQVAKITQGSLPPDLIGTLAINGAGRIRVGARMLGHWFDGDGYLVTLSLDGQINEAKAAGKYVGTARFRAQEEQNRNDPNINDENYEPPLAFSGAWTKAGTGKWYENIGRLPQNPANTATMWLPPLDSSTQSSSFPRLFALCEGGHPIEVDPVTLEVVHDESPFQSHPSSSRTEKVSSYFSAHYSQDPKTHAIYNHGYVINPVLPKINLMKLSPDGFLLEQKESDIPYSTFVHDATISQRHYIYFVTPYVIPTGSDFLPAILGKEALGKMMSWKGNENDNEQSPCMKSYIHIHSKDDLSLKWRIEMPDPISLYHISDAFEEEDENGAIRLKVRVAELHSTDPPADRTKLEQQFANQYAVPSGERLHAKLREYTFSLCDDGSEVGRLVESNDISSGESNSEYRVGAAACEYPITNQIGCDTRLRYTWVNTLSPEAGSDWFDGVQKIDMINGDLSSRIITFGKDAHCGPPFFVSKERLVDTSESNDKDPKRYGEDEGYIVVVLYRSVKHSSDVVVLDSKTMELLCTMELGVHLPFSFHGEFQPQFVIPSN